jgi:hypothetical protein
MTDDNKKALVIGGAVLVIALFIYVTRQQAQALPTAVSVPQSPTISDIGGQPAYTNYNIAPVGSTGINSYPVVSPPAVSIVGGSGNVYTFGGTSLGGSPINVGGSSNPFSIGGSTFNLSNATYDNVGTGGCCCDNTTIPGTINTGNAPTSLNQLMSWYGQINPSLSSQMQTAVNGFTVPQGTISDLTTPLAPASNSSY